VVVQDQRWRALTEAAKDLILKLLQPDPKHRYTAKQALNHRWIKGAREDSILDGSVMEGWADHVQLMQHAYMGTPSPCAPFDCLHLCGARIFLHAQKFFSTSLVACDRYSVKAVACIPAVSVSPLHFCYAHVNTACLRYKHDR
jgi:serine/threonine protein kinase